MYSLEGFSRPETPTLKEKVLGNKIVHMPNITDEAGVLGFGEESKGVKGIERYKLRMLATLDPHDRAFMPSTTKQDAEELFTHYDELYIPHLDTNDIVYFEPNGEVQLSQIVLRDVEQGRTDVRKALEGMSLFVPFIQSEYADRISGLLRTPTVTSAPASEIVNDKGIAQMQLRRLGVPVPDGKTVFTLQEAMQFGEELQKKGYEHLMFKLRRSASATGVFKIGFDEIERYWHLYNKQADESGVLLDGFLKGKIASPNIQFYIGDNEDEDVFISCSDQILSEKDEHLGNINAPNLYFGNPQLVESIRRVNNWSRAQGYRGIVGVDWYITDEELPGKAYFMEVNARINGSTPGALLAEKLHGDNVDLAWGVDNNVAMPKGYTLSDFVNYLDRSRLLYSPLTRKGVLVTNGSTIRTHGKAMVLVMADKPEQITETLVELKSLKEK